MAKTLTTEKVIDEIIRYGTSAAALGSKIIAPNILIALDKPLKTLYQHLDDREREREVRRIIYYMKERGYLAGDYEFGLQLTYKAKRLLHKRDIVTLTISAPNAWDKKWRIVSYDIPNSKSSARRALQEKLHSFGFFHLQSSLLITPFACLEEIKTIAAYYEVSDYLTYFEADSLMNQKLIIKRFQKRFPNTKFY